MPVTLTVWIPESDALALPGALSLIRAAPIHVEREGKARAYVATFANLPHALDLAVQLVGEVINVPNVCVMINGRRVASLPKFWSALICYRDSLGEQNPQAYCARQAARFSDAARCPDRTCLSHCQFICTRCVHIVRENGAQPVSVRLQAIALQAEVEWCPNLKLP